MKVLKELRPIQAMAASLFFKHKKLMVMGPRQYFGKTELGVRIAHELLSYKSTSSSLFVAKNSSARKKATREKFLRIFDPKVFAVNTEMIYLKSHPTAQMFMASIDKDPSAQRGGTLNYIHGSEVAFWNMEHGATIPDTWQMVLRPMLSQRDGYAYLESTPNGSNGWKDLWDMADDLGFHRFKMSLSEMCDLGLVSREEYDKEKKETHPLIFSQEYECNWVTFQGRAYSEFEEDRHVAVVPPPESWQQVIAAIDWGYHPSATCILFGYVKEGILYIFSEIYAYRQLIEQTFEALEARVKLWDVGRLACVADHEADRNEELIRRGISVTKADKVNVLGNRLQIKEMLWRGQIVIDPSCTHLRQDLMSAVWHDRKEGDLDYSLCTEGHLDAEAALRYLVRAFSASEAEEPDTNPHIGLDQASARAWQVHRLRERDS